MLINICIIKPIKTTYPSIFEDSAHCLSHLISSIGINNTITYNTIDPTLINIIFGLGAARTVSIEKFKEIARPNKTIIFNMEQTGSSSDFITPDYIQILSEYTSFDYNQANIEATSTIANCTINSFEIPIAPFFQIKTNNLKLGEINYDYAFYGAINEKRLRTIEKLESMGLRVKKISGAYGENLSDAIIDCKAVLNIHYYETDIFESARALRPTALGIPIISEKSTLPKTINWRESGIHFTERDFHEEALSIAKDINKITELSRKSILFTKNESWIESSREILNKALKSIN